MNNETFIEPLKILGCLYLIFLGVTKLVKTKKTKVIVTNNTSLTAYNRKAILNGLLISVTNPSVPLFFSSIYIIILEKSSTIRVLVFYGICLTLVTTAGLSIIAIAASYFNLTSKARYIFEKTIGIALIGFGISFYAI